MPWTFQDRSFMMSKKVTGNKQKLLREGRKGGRTIMMWALNKKHAIKEKRKRYKSTRIQEIKGIAYRPSNHIKDTVKSV